MQYDDDEEDIYFENDEEMDDKEYAELMRRREELDKVQLELISVDLSQQMIGLNQKLLKEAIKLCQQSFWWRFRSQKAKLEIIQAAFLTMRNVVGTIER